MKVQELVAIALCPLRTFLMLRGVCNNLMMHVLDRNCLQSAQCAKAQCCAKNAARTLALVPPGLCRHINRGSIPLLKSIGLRTAGI